MDIEATRAKIVNAVRCELEHATRPLDLKVRNRAKEGPVWLLGVEPASPNSRVEVLDEALEGSVAWWPGPPKGAADVLSVSSELRQINLRFATTEPPAVGGFFQIYPPRYLEALLAYWEEEDNARFSLKWLESVTSANRFDSASVPALHARLRPPLREHQRNAFHLAGWDAGFLWGPPGTGKTFTLGALLASYLLTFPENRVLVLSTTNGAVDLALVSVDRTLERLATGDEEAAELRRRLFRIGNHFRASNYVGREHLIPVSDRTLLRQLVELESRRPAPENVTEFAHWKSQIEGLRAKIAEETKGILATARLAAMTTTRAVFTMNRIRELKQFDLVVFDEASQVGLAHALAIAPLGRRALFAGDPKQLAPIVQSEDPAAQEWLGQSAFACRNEEFGSECMLTEQSRMVEPICRLVSNVFYGGKLVVAKDALGDSHWSQVREVRDVAGLGTARTVVVAMDGEGTWSARFRGPIRYESAVYIKDLAGHLTRHHNPNDILVLTPFRAQRALVRGMLASNNLARVQVSTVHRAQGSERHTIIFDPTLGDSKFLRTEDARRLVNVALSRAMARLVVVLSPGDLRNPLFLAVSTVIRNADTIREAVPIAQLVGTNDFPRCAIDQVVEIGSVIGRVVGVIEGGRKFVVEDFATGDRRTYVSETVRRRFG